MKLIVWGIAILLILIIIFLLRRWIRRLIFITILLVIAFFIYGLFSPSGAAKLWYNLRTFPDRVSSRFSNQTFLDYDDYKLNLLDSDDVKDEGDDIDLVGDADDASNDAEVNDDKTLQYDDEKEESKKTENTENKLQAIKSFPEINFISLDQENLTNQGNNDNEDNNSSSSNNESFTESELLGSINDYIERNLDDNTEILVTVTYQEDSDKPDKIIMKTQSKDHSSAGTGVAYSGKSKLFSISGLRTLDLKLTTNENDEGTLQLSGLSNALSGSKSTQKITTQGVSNVKTSNNKLSQKDISDAEEITSILF